jgi:hypothetical protein
MSACDRQSHARTTQQKYAGSAYKRHCTREVSALIAASFGVSIQAAPKRSGRNSGHSPSSAQAVIVRSRLLLARTQLSQRKSISLQRRILATKDFREQGTRFSNATTASKGRLESADYLGVRNKRSPPIGKKTISIHETISR